jgi:serine acetyltransferase
VPPNSLVVGVPAKVKKTLKQPNEEKSEKQESING